MDVDAIAIEVLRRILRDKGEVVPEMDRKTILLGGSLGIDSLDLALLLTELETRTGRDPFTAGFVPFQTLGELVALYSDSTP
jgi:acyl carrier protein